MPRAKSTQQKSWKEHKVIIYTFPDTKNYCTFIIINTMWYCNMSRKYDLWHKIERPGPNLFIYNIYKHLPGFYVGLTLQLSGNNAVFYINGTESIRYTSIIPKITSRWHTDINAKGKAQKTKMWNILQSQSWQRFLQ